jgi:glucose/arabinose dehydrogenase
MIRYLATTTGNIFLIIVFSFLVLPVLHVQYSNLCAQPKSNYPGVTIKQIGIVGQTAIRIRRDPFTANLYLLNDNGNIQKVNFAADGTASFTTLYQTIDHGLTEPLGMTFDKNGTIYLVGNQTTGGELATGVIMRGVRDSAGSENRIWSVLAQTVEYPYGHVYNHRMSGLIVDSGGQYLYVNSGARTDHGEIEDSLRETGLTDIILKLPLNGNNIILQNDRVWLKSNGYLFVEGTRNTFDMAYSANWDLFGPDNSDDRDDPDELNWLQQGHHYGFPWRIGGDNTPQQYPNYNPHTDPLLNPATWGGGNLYQTYSNDPAYPPPPAGVTFTEPIPSAGPNADNYRDTVTGQVKEASSLGTTISTFTPHRSPDGIVFDRDSMLAGDLKGDAFVVSINNNNLVADMKDTSDDLLYISLIKSNGNYTAKVRRLVSGFNSPLGIELVTDTLYVLETGLEAVNTAPKLWEIILPAAQPAAAQERSIIPNSFALYQNYPNPFNPSTIISWQLGTSGFVSLKIYDILGNEITTLVNEYQETGRHSVEFNTQSAAGRNYVKETFSKGVISSGVYFYSLTVGDFVSSKKMLLLK